MNIAKSLALSLAGLSMAFAANADTVSLINGTTSEISAVYISSNTSDDWEENIIDGYVLPSGSQVNINIPNYEKFDLLVESSEGGQEDYRDFPGNVTQITLHGAGKADYK